MTLTIFAMYCSDVTEMAQGVAAAAAAGQGCAPDGPVAGADVDVADGLVQLTTLVQAIYAHVSERRDLARRSPVPGDRRALQVTLTDAGHQAAAAFHAEIGAELSRLMSPLSPRDREQFRSTMAEIIAR